MISEEVKEAFKKVNPSLGIREYDLPEKGAQWNVLFGFYNKNHNNRLSKGCAPCFGKVYVYVKSKINEESEL